MGFIYENEEERKEIIIDDKIKEDPKDPLKWHRVVSSVENRRKFNELHVHFNHLIEHDIDSNSEFTDETNTIKDDSNLVKLIILRLNLSILWI